MAIYKIECSENGYVYIGQTNNPDRREREHFGKLKSGSHPNRTLQADFNQYGKPAFSFDVIEALEIENKRQLEQYWLEKYNATKVYNRYNPAKITNRHNTRSTKQRIVDMKHIFSGRTSPQEIKTEMRYEFTAATSKPGSTITEVVDISERLGITVETWERLTEEKRNNLISSVFDIWVLENVEYSWGKLIPENV